MSSALSLSAANLPYLWSVLQEAVVAVGGIDLCHELTTPAPKVTSLVITSDNADGYGQQFLSP